MWSHPIVIMTALIASCSIVWLLLRKLYTMIKTWWWLSVPFIRSKEEWIQTLLTHLTMKPWQCFFDIWCGDGVVMAAVLEKFPGVIAYGFEVDPQVSVLAEPYQKQYGERFFLQNINCFTADFSHADVLYAYLQPRFMKPLREKMKKECSPWTLLYSNTFPIKHIKPIQEITIPINTQKHIVMYVYQI